MNIKMVFKNRIFFPAVFVVFGVYLFVNNRDHQYFMNPRPSAVSVAQGNSEYQQNATYSKFVDSLKSVRTRTVAVAECARLDRQIGSSLFDAFTSVNQKSLLDSARFYLERSWAQSPTSDTCAFLLGRTMSTYRDKEKAAFYFDKVIALAPRNAGLLHNVGLYFYFELAQTAKAKICLQKVLAIDPRFPLTNYALGKMALDEKNVSVAQGFFESEIMVFETQKQNLAQFGADKATLEFAAASSYLELAMMKARQTKNADAAKSFLDKYIALMPNPANQAKARESVAQAAK